jgi:transposase-like protein
VDRSIRWWQIPSGGRKRRGERKMRKHYADEFKAKVGLEALEGASAINELASKYGVHPNMIIERKR